MPLTLQFLGSARTVTGSNFLVTCGGHRVLVDCGLFQGMKDLRLRNWSPLPVDPATIRAVVVTHAHLDHCGYLPRLARQGFRGPVYCSAASAEPIGLLLPDSGHLQAEFAKIANKKGFSKHRPALPLYTEEEGREALKLLRPIDYDRATDVGGGVNVTLHPAGHILGSAFVEMNAGGVRTVFSGDLGAYDRVVMQPPAPLPPDADYVLVESTYGGRRQDHRPVQEQMRERIGPVLLGGGIVIIPSFAIGRSTLVLYHLRQLVERRELPQVPIFIDSPMATDAVEIYCRFSDEHNLRPDLLRDSHVCPIRPQDVRLVRSVEESKQLNDLKGPAIIIAASGMAAGGRVVHHLHRRLPLRENLVLLVGYQAIGTRGRSLLEGAEKVRIFGDEVRVKAQVAAINGLSAHGDAGDIVRWLGTASRPPKRTFLVHGEEKGLAAMAQKVGGELRFPHSTPDYLAEATLT
ncbi:MAG: MBL fold metallo-hydrolase [Planctomycetes bacterium]|nr:MBL fold metallo-hydrolase [Planctomycetota bacterium]